MAITTLLQENWKEDKAKLEDAVSSLKKSMKESKKVRKSEWKLLKSKFKDDMKQAKKSLKDLKAHCKK